MRQRRAARLAALPLAPGCGSGEARVGAVRRRHEPALRDAAAAAGPRASVVAVRRDPASGLRLAAALAREGARVALVRGGTAVWPEIEHARAAPQPRGG